MVDELSLDNILNTMKQIEKTRDRDEKLSLLDEYHEILKRKIVGLASEITKMGAKVSRHSSTVALYSERMVPNRYAANNMNIKTDILVNQMENMKKYGDTLQHMMTYVNATLFDKFTEKKTLHEDIHNPKFIAYLSCTDTKAHIKQDLLKDANYFIVPIQKRNFNVALKNINDLVSKDYNVLTVRTFSKKLRMAELANLTQEHIVNRFNSNNPHNLVVASEEVIEDEDVYAPEQKSPELEDRINPSYMVYQ